MKHYVQYCGNATVPFCKDMHFVSLLACFFFECDTHTQTQAITLFHVFTTTVTHFRQCLMTLNAFYAAGWLKKTCRASLSCLSVLALKERGKGACTCCLVTNEAQPRKRKPDILRRDAVGHLTLDPPHFRRALSADARRKEAEGDATWREKARSAVRGNLAGEITDSGLPETDEFLIASGEITVCPGEE